jgi:hypothetical protein
LNFGASSSKWLDGSADCPAVLPKIFKPLLRFNTQVHAGIEHKVKNNPSPALDILTRIETSALDSHRKVFNLLSIDPSSKVARFIIQNEPVVIHEPFRVLLSAVSQIIEAHHIRRNVTDWPFENFWGNPYEPRHSKLLGYFLNPEAKHGCGPYLLQSFLMIVADCFPQAGHGFPPKGCRVKAEYEYIDLCIESGCGSPKFAVIIENKINWARDQKNQLKRYVDHVHQRGFKCEEIYVLYLPLTGDKDPDPADRACIENLRANYNKITFGSHIMKWLNEVLAKWPSTLDGGMRENLCHYRNLIDYLNRQEKELRMSVKILEQIKLAKENNTLPTLSEVEGLKQATEALQQCMRQVLRKKLLGEIQEILAINGHKTRLCVEGKPAEEIVFVSLYDEQFVKANINLCLPVTEAVSVCLGGNTEFAFWIGYMRSGSHVQQAVIERIVWSEAKGQFKIDHINEKDSTYYAWCWKEVAYDFNNVTDTAPGLAAQLLQMHNSLRDFLAVKNVE